MESTKVLPGPAVCDAVLAFVVAGALGVHVVRAEDADGLLHGIGDVPDGSRAVIVADTPPPVAPLRAIEAMLRDHGGDILALGVLALSGMEATTGIWPTVAVVDAVALGGVT